MFLSGRGLVVVSSVLCGRALVVDSYVTFW
jgi:hypothetical protein